MSRSVAIVACCGIVCSFVASAAIAENVAKPEYARLELQPIDEVILGAFGPKLGDAIEDEEKPLTKEKIDLGRMLYYENRLSKNQQISCNTCHQLDKYGVDNQPTSSGHKNQKGGRNSPTVYNAAGHIAQFWDGRAKDVEEQAKGPILNPIEMAMKSSDEVLATLKSIPGYVDLFKKAFPQDKDPITYDNLAAAIGAFERKLVTPSRFDKFLAGDKSALKDEEVKGFQTFIATGCITCHSGTYLGGKMYQKVGLAKPWPNVKDIGRQEVTKGEGDKHVFKVPSLRNIAMTGPYLHDGSVLLLDTQVRLMARHQLGKELSDEDVKSIVTFLHTLTGEIPKDYIKKPELPPSGPNTPKAEPD